MEITTHLSSSRDDMEIIVPVPSASVDMEIITPLASSCVHTEITIPLPSPCVEMEIIIPLSSSRVDAEKPYSRSSRSGPFLLEVVSRLRSRVYGSLEAKGPGPTRVMRCSSRSVLIDHSHLVRAKHTKD